MGDVYRAKDTRLNRDVALKTVKGAFTERFEREAKAISSLNHPNICTLYDVGEHSGSGYLVMEFIDGKPIAGPLPVDQAIQIGIQICDALYAAHKKGIVHRDLKPANILVTKQGVKLLDFGLAKLTAAAPGSGAYTPPATAVVGDQQTVAALTGAHTVVGTPQYMAPEQISGGEVDARTDIFALGCVLYELVTGVRAFDGKSASSIMASVLAMTPKPIDELVPLTPPALDRVIRRCLEKDPEDRWQSARDVSAELKWIAEGGSKVGLPTVVTVKRKNREHIAWALCGVAALAAIGFGVAWMKRAPQPPQVVRFPLPLPDGLSNPTSPEVSPDGRQIAFIANNADGAALVYLRSMDVLQPRALPGTDGARRLFWSPDSRQIAFTTGGKLKKVDISGGPPQTICDTPTGSDGSWSPAGTILFDGQDADPIWEVPAAGGVPKVKVPGDPKKGITATGWPVFLPDGRHFLYMNFGQNNEQTLLVGTLDSDEHTELFKTTSRVLYTDPGYLLFVRENTLVAQKFDVGSLKVQGDAVPVGEGLGVDSVGLASFSASRNGVLAFRAGEVAGRRLVWMDRSGKITPALDGLGDYRDVTMSPDATRFAFDSSSTGTNGDVWIRDLVRNVTSRFTFDSAVAQTPLWSPDGRSIVYTSRSKGPGDLMIKDVSGTREPELLLATPEAKFASDWSPDGKYILYSFQAKGSGFDTFALPTTGDKKPIPVAQTKFDELFARFSPDGRYVAYFSNESGRAEVYVQEFPEPKNKVQVSTSGGTDVYWRRDGKELFYRNGPRLMAVPIQTSPTFTVGTPTELFQAPFATGVTVRSRYIPAKDGQRFLVLASPNREVSQPASVVLNWTEALK
jgi:serine/threonine protein kinase/Tol biopolymer transport system component